jgi:hypothetical protein
MPSVQTTHAKVSLSNEAKCLACKAKDTGRTTRSRCSRASRSGTGRPVLGNHDIATIGTGALPHALRLNFRFCEHEKFLNVAARP